MLAIQDLNAAILKTQNRCLTMNQQDIFNFSGKALCQWFQDHGQPSFRARQLMQALWQQDLATFEAMTVFPKPLRKLLSGHFFIPAPWTPAQVQAATDNTQKVLFELTDRAMVESVGLPKTDGALTFCLSTQVGCAMNCRFCATAAMGLIRHLTAAELIGQIRGLSLLYHRAPTNLVFMGMGEPLQNLAALRTALDILTDKHGWGWSPQRITVSSCGWLPGLEQLIEKPMPAQLAISLNAATNNVRNRLMPINRRYPLEKVLDAVRRYSRVTKQQITFEYILIGHMNDSETDARILCRLLKNINAKVNIIPYNPVHNRTFSPPAEAGIDLFLTTLKQAGITATCRRSQGQSINAACGQLAVTQSRRNA